MYRVMIADDEPTIRRGLMNFIKWDRYGCEVVYEAYDGVDARDNLAAANPDIVIADIKMPGISGLELAEYIQKNFSGIKVIILTGYSEFSLAQAAIRYGVVDFVLKPTSTEKIEVAVLTAISLLLQQNESQERLRALDIRATQSLEEGREKFIYDVISGIISDVAQIGVKIAELEIQLENYYVLVFNIDINDSSGENTNSKNTSYLYSVLKKIICQTFKELKHYEAPVNKHNFCSILSFDNADCTQCREIVAEKCKSILEIFHNFSWNNICVGISAMHKLPEEIPVGYNESLSALFSKFYCNSDVLIYAENTLLKTQEEEKIYFKELYDIINNIYSCQNDSASILVDSFIANLREQRHTIEYLKHISLYISTLIFKFSNYGYLSSPSDISDGNKDIYKKILGSGTVNELLIILSDMMKETIDSSQNMDAQDNFIVRKVMKYIEENYSSDINLQSIADYVYMNSSYLSRLFHKVTNETLTEALAKIRVDEAKKLLANSNIKTYEVAAKVGINDSAYFSYLFKKYTGITPREFKNGFIIR